MSVNMHVWVVENIGDWKREYFLWLFWYVTFMVNIHLFHCHLYVPIVSSIYMV